jgi:hypothetical protein
MSVAAHLLLVLARHIAPAHRSDWIAAMQAELQYAPNRDRLIFAAGCLFSALYERTLHMFRSGIGAAKLICLSACALLAALGFGNAARFNDQDPMLVILFCLSAVIWSAALVAIALKRWRSLGHIAIGGLMLSAVQGLSILLAMPAVQQNAALIWALFQEGLVLFGALFGAAQVFNHKQDEAIS